MTIGYDVVAGAVPDRESVCWVTSGVSLAGDSSWAPTTMPRNSPAKAAA
jgi:hypothetical protein